MPTTLISTTGLCECGCGNPAPVADRNHAKYGHVKGQPLRFIRGHAARGRVVGDVERARISATHKGKPKSTEQRRKMSAAQLGPKGNNWRGGAIVREGRALRYVGRDHPMADTYGYVYEHRFVMAEHLGRPLEASEQVHHVDLDKTNNAIENLVVLTRSQHRRLHNLIRDKHVGPLEALLQATS